MREKRLLRLAVAAALLATAPVATLCAQAPSDPAPPLREAHQGEVWITQPTFGAVLPAPPQPSRRPLASDNTSPSAPSTLTASAAGFFLIEATWSEAVDAESGIREYAFAVGTGTTPATEANVIGWQSNGLATTAKVNFVLAPATAYYFSVFAINGGGFAGPAAQSGPLVAAPRTIGDPGNRLSFEIVSNGLDKNGAKAATWPPEKAAALVDFLDRMLPVLSDLYGPPATTYTVRLVRDLRYSASAVYLPKTDEIHAGNDVTYQLLTHELVHAWRRDQILTSGPQWQYDPTLSGFEEGFAQAVSYEAMTEFARRNPSFGLSQLVYQSSSEWDYDFQNVPELRTRGFWSDSGGMLLYWIRYEMAAAAIAKIEREHPGFCQAFNAEYYRRLSLDQQLTLSRSFVVDIIATVAPSIEGRPAAKWINEQYIFDCADHPGLKVWLFTQHYPAPTDYFVFNRIYFYETFSNGSDWVHPNGSSGYDYYSQNGSTGAATLSASSGSVVWQSPLRITPTDNPPVYNGFGNENVYLTTQATNLPWPGGDPSRFVTGLLGFDLYGLSIQFKSGTTVTNHSWQVIGSPIRTAIGVFGGIVGANGGRISLHHRSHPSEPAVPVVNGVFHATPSWASQPNPDTATVDSDPGIVDVTYVDAAGKTYTDVRVIGYGSAYGGSELFLFDVGRMTRAHSIARTLTPTVPPQRHGSK